MTLNKIETQLADGAAAIVPWLAPLAPAYMAYRNMMDVLLFPLWLSLLMALVIECLGLAAIHTIFMFTDWKQTARKVDTAVGGRPPVAVALAVYAGYLVIILSVNIALDLEQPFTHQLARVLLSLLSVPAGVIIAIRAGHHKRVTAVSVAKSDRTVARQKKKLDRTVTGQNDSDRTVATDGQGVDTAVAIVSDNKVTARDTMVTPVHQLTMVDIIALDTSEVARLLNVSKRTARRRKETARDALNRSQNGTVI